MWHEFSAEIHKRVLLKHIALSNFLKAVYFLLKAIVFKLN
jgi:hypothetical protein